MEPLAPDQTIEMYLDARKDELTEATLDGQTYRLDAFEQFCAEEGIENLNDLSGRDLYAYRVWRREGQGRDREPIEPITLRGQLATLRSLLRFAAEVDAVPEDLRTKVPLPSVSGAAGVSDTTLEPDRVNAILDHLRKYEYASMKNVITLLLWHTGARMGGIRALDVGDVSLDNDNPGLQFVHRPDTDMSMNNKENGERWNAISEYVAEVVRDYIDGPRPAFYTRTAAGYSLRPVRGERPARRFARRCIGSLGRASTGRNAPTTATRRSVR
nr:tyrosine-type recombinase/integrase [Halomicroarcula laminariae]